MTDSRSPEPAIHAMGNGHLLVYGRGPEITHVFGPNYSTGSLLSAAWTSVVAQQRTHSRREPGTGIWLHTIATSQQERVASIRTAVHPDRNVFAISVKCSADLRVECRASRPGVWLVDPDGARATLTTEPGAPVFIYPDVGAPSASVLVDNGCRLWQHHDQISIEVPAGYHELRILVADGCVPPDMSDETDNERLFARRREVDHAVTAPLAEHGATWRHCAPWGQQAAGRLEGAVLSLLAQQSADGGIVAGYPYPLAYGRDQYGACRGLSALGYADESARNFWFRHAKLRHFGHLANAESMGHDRIRHTHENDAVELTSYHVLHAIELADQPMAGFEIEPLVDELLECLRIQLDHLRLDTLPFNGDETYVAGGILPRTVLEDGSLESTLLFAEAARRLQPLVRRASSTRGGDVWAAARRIDACWRQRFPHVPGSGLTVNFPARRHLPPITRMRPGVCECCGSIGPEPKHRTGNGRYVCQSCGSSGNGEQLAPAGMQRYNILSATLLPYLINRSLLTQDEDAQLRNEVMARLRETGEIRTATPLPKSVGYDAALLVLATASGADADRSLAVSHLLQHFDEADSLSEYYQDSRPAGTRCRPWETGVALCALVAAVAGAQQHR